MPIPSRKVSGLPESSPLPRLEVSGLPERVSLPRLEVSGFPERLPLPIGKVSGKKCYLSSPDSSGNPDIAKGNYDEIALFLAMTD